MLLYRCHHVWGIHDSFTRFQQLLGVTSDKFMQHLYNYNSANYQPRRNIKRTNILGEKQEHNIHNTIFIQFKFMLLSRKFHRTRNEKYSQNNSTLLLKKINIFNYPINHSIHKRQLYFYYRFKTDVRNLCIHI